MNTTAVIYHKNGIVENRCGLDEATAKKYAHFWAMYYARYGAHEGESVEFLDAVGDRALEGILQGDLQNCDF